MSTLNSDRIFLYREPINMNCGYDGLAGIAKSLLNEDPFSGAYFVFLNKRKDRVKIFYWDRDGFAIWMKRLERGSFVLPCGEISEKQCLDRRLLFMVLEGMKECKKTKRFSLK